MAILTTVKLENWLHYAAGTISVEELAQTEIVVTGWLLDATDLDTLPDPLGARWEAWFLELAGIAFENPTSLTTDTTLDQTTSWYGKRREEILSRARAWAQRQAGASSATPRPRGRFPAALPWPECGSTR